MRRLLARCLLLATFAAPVSAQAGQVEWTAFGQGFLKRLGETTPPTLFELLDRHYTRLQLADFDLRVPTPMLGNADDLGKVAAIAGALIDLQDRLAEWTTADAAALKARRAEFAALRKAFGAWRGKPAGTPPPSLPQAEPPCVLVLAPDRLDFLGFVGWLGLWKPVNQEIWWADATAQFTDLRLQDDGSVQVIALQYAAPDQHGDVRVGYDMNTREKTGLLQHVAQRAALSWCWRHLSDDADTSFVLGFATALVVDVLGQNNARSGGSGKTHSTNGQGGFIPGAPSMGGGMPVQTADSNWRHSLGQDWFARPLRQAQKAGEHEAQNSRDKLGHFLLHDQKGEQKHLVSGPFLGQVALAREVVPAAFLDDYLEFHRAYRAAFVHWLENNGGKTKALSLEHFRTLLHRLGALQKGETFDALCQELYGLPLAAGNPETDTLERRFLAWLVENVK